MSMYDYKLVEEKVIREWKQSRVYEKVKELNKGKRPFYFIDGPPYATGSIHMGTAWNKIIKDVYLRFFRMAGYDTWDQPGYDTHGTPIETQVEKELGFKSKKDIEKFGVGNFVKKCREFATKYIDVMNDQFANLGVWMDWKRPYLTLDNEYIEGAWYTFKKAFENKFLYKGKYPVHVCPRCATVVAYNEIEYTKQTDNSIYVKFQTVDDKNKYFVIWTTTPWTLPGNTGIMVHPKFTYVEAELSSGEVWIVAKDRLQSLMDAIEAGYKVIREFPGKELEGMTYVGPLHDKLKLPGMPKAYRVILSDRYVHLEDGTGLVHTAPGHGKEDFDAGMKEGLPAICPVEIDGSLTKETGKYAGKRARVVDEEIINDLIEEGTLVYKHPYTHDYPICWRCSEPLLQIGVPQWFFKVTGVRDTLLSENKKVNWVPKWAGDRFNDWLENLADWPISRQRYWGIPLPIWECDCGNIVVIGSYEEMKRKSGLTSEIDFHRPAIDKVKIKCEKCGKDINRVPDVLDVWFDSGVCTWASLGYPRKKELFDKMWPSVFQTEGPDQFRGWWNSQMITSVLTFGKTPFRNVMMHGFIMDVKGIKLSKSKGNFIDPSEVLDKYGRDVLRFYLLSNPLWNDFYFNWDEIKETSRMFTVLWNSYKFIKTYTKIKQVSKPVLNVEDEWIISKFNSTLEFIENGKKYEIHKLFKGLRNFILNDFSRWYIKIIRDRVSPWYTGKDRAGAEYTLNYIFKNFLKTMAPAIPHLSDYIYSDLYSKSSVHLLPLPKKEEKAVDKDLEAGMEIVKNIIEAMNYARQEKGIKLRWPLDFVEVTGSKGNQAKLEKTVTVLSSVITNMGNVKEVRVVKRIEKGSEFLIGTLKIGDYIEDESLLRELVRNVQISRKKEKLAVNDKISINIETDKKTRSILEGLKDSLLSGVGAGSVKFEKITKKEIGTVQFKNLTVKYHFKKV